MKRISTAFLILVFAGLAVFGFAMMNHEVGHQCLVSTFLGEMCTKENGLKFFGLHLDVFKQFSSAIMVAALSLLSIFAVIVFRLILPEYFSLTRVRIRENRPSIRRKINHWIALHEESPNRF